MRALIFDPFAGISGDMILAALVDLGLEVEALRELADSLGLQGIGLRADRTERRGIACAQVQWELPEERSHRHLGDVLEIIDRARVSPWVKERAEQAFRLLAGAEASVHGVGEEQVHFHEVGALDAILDVVGACVGIEDLGFEGVYTRPVTLGRGWVEMAHGRFPVPAPATLKLLEGLPVREAGLDGECTTPTGAALLSTLVSAPEPPVEMVVTASGYGAGTRDPEDRPNCLRAVACVQAAAAGTTLYLVQSDVDDLSPEYVPAAQEALLDAGALDAVRVPLGMKKGRPGIRLEALAPAPVLDSVLEALFRSTSTIGARYWPVERSVLAREEVEVEWRGQRLRRKVVHLPGGGVRTKLEYDDVARAAQSLGLSPHEVRTAMDQGLGSIQE